MSLETNIREKRKEKNVSREYVAERLEVSSQAVSKWETGKSEPSTNNFIKLAELFSCDVNELLTFDKAKKESAMHTKKRKSYTILGIIISFICYVIGMLYAEQVPLLTIVGILGLSGTMYIISNYFSKL